MTFEFSKEWNKYLESNKHLWKRWTSVHVKSDFYDVDAFKGGKEMLKSIELQEVGDVNGKKMLHLQCHFGVDSLCWTRRGADVTGVDFCPESIEEARKLNEELALNARFVCNDIYGLKNVLKDERSQFDIVYTSYGVLDWLPDLNQWASVISYFLKPEGFFYLVEFHQFTKVFDDNYERVAYCYDNREVIVSDVCGSYAVPEANIDGKEFTWNHSISELLNSLIKNGLRIEFFNEHMKSPFDCFGGKSVSDGNGYFYIPSLENKVPLIFSMKASKQ